ncbi:MAG: SDR family oxidoreductase [Candidatus Eremiobacteraeota bacterium]|nr:SDR family oxidoreductase [Candidatus Eremiobacteraeota bacterium]
MKNTALITGASTGIGKELAVLHAERGGDMVIVARSEDKLQELKAELESNHGVEVRVLAYDLTDREAPSQIFQQLREEEIEIEFLINNAGFGGVGKFHQREWSDELAMINLNVVALAELTRLFLPAMVARGRGRVLNVSSTASLMPGPLQAVYFATKAFVTSLSNALAEELKDTGVTVTALMPGATETEFARAAGMENTPLFEKTASARRVAEDGYNGMLAGKLDVISGLNLFQRILLALVPLTPKRIVLSETRKLQEVE